MTRSLYDLDAGQLEALVAEAGEPPYRARQVGHAPGVGLAPVVQPVGELARPVGRLAGLGDQRLELAGVQVVQRARHGVRIRSKAART